MATLVAIRDKGGKVDGFKITGDTQMETDALNAIIGGLRPSTFAIKTYGFTEYNARWAIFDYKRPPEKIDSVFDVKAIKDEAEKVIRSISETKKVLDDYAISAYVRELKTIVEHLRTLRADAADTAENRAKDMRKAVDEQVLQIPAYTKMIQRQQKEIERLNGSVSVFDKLLQDSNRESHERGKTIKQLEDNVRQQAQYIARIEQDWPRKTSSADVGNYINCRLEANEQARNTDAGKKEKWEYYEKLARERAEEIIKLRDEQAKTLINFNKAFSEKVQEIAELKYHGPRREGKTIDAIHMEYWTMRYRAEDAEKQAAELSKALEAVTKQLVEEKKNTMISGKNIFEIHTDMEYHIAKYKALKDELSRLSNGL